MEFTTQTGLGKRYTPAQYFEKESMPLLVVNCTFFEFVHNANLNVVVKDGKMIAYNLSSLPGKGKDTFTYHHPLGSAFGIKKNRKADIAWLYTDSTKLFPYASQFPVQAFTDSNYTYNLDKVKLHHKFKKWKMQTAIGGGPVLLQNGKIAITNNEELKFSGKAINDKHPRTAIGYTYDGRVLILVIQGRFPGLAEGASLIQEANILKELGCKEAMNLDGGGSSCLLVNGKQTITPSDKEGERPLPAVFMIKKIATKND